MTPSPTKPKIAAALLFIALIGFGNSIVLAAPKQSSDDKRFVVHDDKTLTDTRSGLMWQKKDSYLETGHWLNWHEAFKYIDQLNEAGYGGYIDWRLPTTNELQSLFEADKINSKQVGREMVIHIDPVFDRNGSGVHWSIQANGQHNAFGIVYNTGDRFSAPKTSRARKAVRAVRN